MKIVHLISGLERGGAETVLYRLLTETDQSVHSSVVISFQRNGEMAGPIRELGVPVYELGMRKGIGDLGALIQLKKLLQQLKPDLIQTWMYHADLIGSLVARMSGNIPVVWGIRHSDLDPQRDSRLTILVAKLASWISRWPAAIICCSQASLEIHSNMGYKRKRMLVIPNGYDLSLLKKKPESGIEFRREHGVGETVLLIGTAGRYHPQKDQRTFIRAAAILSATRPEVEYVMCGKRVDENNGELSGWIEEDDLVGKVHLLGILTDMPAFYNALDLFTLSSSHGEGFPNVVAEAMACEVPAVVTDVGDAALIVGATGRVVPTGDPVALAAAWEEMLRMPVEQRARQGRLARERIQQNYSIQRMIERYYEAYSRFVS